jgi:hypothetical protein
MGHFCIEVTALVYLVISIEKLECRTWNCYKSVRFELFMAVSTKNGVFWDVTPCGSCKNQR